jgi:outer membrane lipoprotein carrier protein
MLCIPLSIALWLAAPPALSARALADNVQKAYRSAGDMTGTFTQIYTDKLRNTQRREAGHLWVKGDGRVRWTYETPEPKEFIFNGSTAFFYEPQSAQVTVFEHFSETPLAHAMQFLWGAGDLLKMFDLALADKEADCPSLKEGELALRLRPRQPLAAVDHVYMVVKRFGLRVCQSRVVDRLGNITDYLFDGVRFGTRIDGSQFAFSLPEGVDVLRASTPQAPKPPAAASRPSPGLRAKPSP